MTELRHCIATRWYAQYVMNQPLNELLGDIFTGQVPLREFTRCQKFIEGDGLGGEWNRLVLTEGHAEDTSWLT